MGLAEITGHVFDLLGKNGFRARFNELLGIPAESEPQRQRLIMEKVYAEFSQVLALAYAQMVDYHKDEKTRIQIEHESRATQCSEGIERLEAIKEQRGKYRDKIANGEERVGKPRSYADLLAEIEKEHPALEQEIETLEGRIAENTTSCESTIGQQEVLIEAYANKALAMAGTSDEGLGKLLNEHVQLAGVQIAEHDLPVAENVSSHIYEALKSEFQNPQKQYARIRPIFPVMPPAAPEANAAYARAFRHIGLVAAVGTIFAMAIIRLHEQSQTNTENTVVEVTGPKAALMQCDEPIKFEVLGPRYTPVEHMDFGLFGMQHQFLDYEPITKTLRFMNMHGGSMEEVPVKSISAPDFDDIPDVDLEGKQSGVPYRIELDVSQVQNEVRQLRRGYTLRGKFDQDLTRHFDQVSLAIGKRQFKPKELEEGIWFGEYKPTRIVFELIGIKDKTTYTREYSISQKKWHDNDTTKR